MLCKGEPLMLVMEVSCLMVVRLANEIIAFERYMRPSIDETKAVKKAISEVEHVINSTLDRSSCQVMGSYSTGLAMPWSDIDFAIALPAIQEEAETHHKSLTSLKYQKIYRRTLFRLEQSFARSPNFTNSPKVIRAHIPIVQVTHRRTGLQVQVQIQTGPRQQQQYILAYLAEYPTLRLLYFILRSCLELRRLNITFEGGLGSYSILMMIVNALKHASGRYDAHDVANQLLHVLEFYANSDLYRNGFSVDPPRVFRKARLSMTPEERMLRATDPVLRGIDSMAMPNPRQRYLLCLQDPADLNNDLGSKAYAIKHIQATFGVARKTVLEAMEAWNRRSDIASEDAKNTGLLDALVGGNYRRFNADRDKVKEYGSSRAHGLGIRHSSHKGVREGVERKERKYSAREMLEKVIEVDKRKAAAISEKTQP